MRITKWYMLLLLLIGFAACSPDSEFQNFRKDFVVPPNEFRTVPFWVWNGVITEEMIDEQLEDMKLHGIGGVFVHPRYGLITEYASQEWYDLVAYALKKAKSMDMNLWLYDENSFPSGFAGGHVPAEMPSSYNEGQALKLHRQNRLEPDTTKEYLHIFKEHIEITDKVDSLRGRRGDFLLYELIYYPQTEWYAGYSYVDLLKPGVTEKFIEVSMTGYEEAIGSDFGSWVPGIFTDEPNIAPQGGEGLIRWTPDLFEQFEKRWGYKLGPHLVSLVEDVGDYRTVRHNYYQLLLDLFIKRWSKPWYEYTEKHNLKWTGHYWEHGWPSPHHGPDHMAMYAWHQIPGIDMLFNNWDARPDQFGNVRAVRELNSIGNQLGRNRKLSETYGAAGWELTFEDMKRNGDWEYVLGVNFMNQHLSYQTIMGDRKHDFPQSFSYHTPWWDEYNSLADYFARLSMALSTGVQKNKVMVLEPSTSAWMYYGVEAENIDIPLLNEEFTSLLNLLEQEQIEYDLGSERVIADHGSIDNGQFVIGEQEYNYVVLPAYMHNINEATADLLELFLSRGGSVLAVGQAPIYIDGVRSERCLEWQKNYPDAWVALNGMQDPRFINYLLTDEFIMVEQEGGNLYHHRRIVDDGQILFLVNSSKDEACKLRLVMQGNDMVEMNLFTGATENYPCVVTSDILSFDAEIPATGSLLLYISDKEIKGPRSREVKWRGKEQEIALKNLKVKPSDPNVINLDYCYLTMAEDTTDLIYFYDAQTRIFNAHGFPKNPWVSASQYKTSIIDRDTFGMNTGFEASFPVWVDASAAELAVELVVERPELYEVTLNGKVIESTEGKWGLDKNFGVFELGSTLIAGENFINVKTAPMSVFCELEPVYLTGEFAVTALDTGWILSSAEEIQTGSWKHQGYPFYSKEMAYNATAKLGKKGNAKVVLPDWKGTIAVVSVNGKRVGQVFNSPGEIRIDPYVKRGTNEISVTVFGSLKNMLGPHHNVTTRGIVTPWSFKFAPKEQPSGLDYDLLDYGLMDPFQVFVSE